MTNFDEYIRQIEPDKKEKGIIWQTAIGLQQVDGLKPSAYLIETAKQNIEGNITFDEVKNRIDAYYKALNSSGATGSAQDDRTEEADKVSARIAEILSEKTFSFSPAEYIGIHRRLFHGIYKFAGKIRDYNITKSEWALDGETVFYASADTLKETLEYDFEQEKIFDYKTLTARQIVEHIAHFAAYLWQIHVFGEGNTRTTAVFLIKYLRKLGFNNINNELFADHSWYFRNALVRANYQDVTRGIHKTDTYLIRFLSNVLLNENNILKNRELHIRFAVSENVDVNGLQTLGVNENVPSGLGVSGVEKLGVNLNNNQLKILDLIQHNNRITIIEMAKAISISETAVENNIKKLRKMGLLSRAGSDKTGQWTIQLSIHTC